MGSLDLNESQEVEDLLRDVYLFQLDPNQPRPSSPLTVVDESSTTNSATHQSSKDDDLRREMELNELDRWDETLGQGDSDDGRHLCLQGARNFLDPSLFVPVTAVDEDALQDLSKLWQDVYQEREKTRKWAERMRYAVETWARVRTNTHITAIQTLEDQLTEALQNCRRQQVQIRQLELLVAELKNEPVTNPPSKLFEETPIKEQPMAQRDGTPFTTLPPPTVSPTSPLSAGSPTDGSPAYFELRPSSIVDPSSPPKTKHRKRRINKGCEIIEYPNGATREIYIDHEVLRHRNQDVEIIYPHQRRYYFAKSKTLRITDPEKTTYYYSNSQSEIHWNDGRKLIRFADGTMHEMEHSVAATV